MSAAERDFLTVTGARAVTTICIDRPHVLNAIHPPLHRALEAAFDEFAGDPSRRICVLTGAGDRAFCVGSDLKYVAARRAAGDSEILTRLPAHGYGGLAQRFDLGKPVIAAVNGLALGGGFELALACDLIIAADTARFGLPEVNVGGFAHNGGAARLARHMPLKRAMAMLLTGDTIDAHEALDLGLVNEVVPLADLGQATRRWCDRLLAGAPMAMALAKQATLRGLDVPGIAAAMLRQPDYPEYKAWLAADEVTEGATAFAQGRAPRWRREAEGQ